MRVGKGFEVYPRYLAWDFIASNGSGSFTFVGVPMLVILSNYFLNQGSSRPMPPTQGWVGRLLALVRLSLGPSWAELTIHNTLFNKFDILHN